MTPIALIPLQVRNIEEETKWMKYVGLAHAQKPITMNGFQKRCAWSTCQQTQSAKLKVFRCCFRDCMNVVDDYCCKRYVYIY